MSEYGIPSPEEITWKWTPAQAIVMAECVRRRRALERAEETHLLYVATAAAQGSKKAFSALRSAIKRLHVDAGVGKPTDPEGLARSLGLTDRRMAKPPSEAAMAAGEACLASEKQA